MPELLTLQQFEPLLNHRFVVHVHEKSSFVVELIEVAASPKRGAILAREPFALIFRGPLEFYVPQRMYPLQNEVLGTNDFFLVPIGPDEIGHRYEAIFS